VLKKGEVKMILKMIKQGLSKSEIARRLGLSRDTVRKYANKPEGYVPVISRTPVENSVDPFLPHIGVMLQTASRENVEIPTTVIYDEIKRLGYEGSLRWLQTVLGRYELRRRAKEEGKLIRFETAPGEQMQVDWVEFPHDNLSAFVATLGYSRASYVEYVNNEKIETLIGCHLNAYAYFGGVPKEVLYDNMRTVITKRNAHGRGKHKFNPLFEDFSKHCGVALRVCKPYRAQTKGKVERFNHYLRYSFHNGLRVKLAMKRYELNIHNANAEVLKWLNERANVRIHQTTLQRPLELLAYERTHLQPIPMPYMGINPKVLIRSVANPSSDFKAPIIPPSLYIPPRDMLGYDTIIPSIALLSLPLIESAYGALLWR
jgi:transposase